MARHNERSLRAVPLPVLGLLVLTLLSQIAFHRHSSENIPIAEALPSPPRMEILTVASLGDRVLVSKLVMLWLQAFDYQPGISLRFQELDYARLIAWLKLVLRLHPETQYPLLSAARVYAEINDPLKQRQMLDFVAAEFERDPNRRWPWMAHAVFVAKHRMRDPDYALRLAERLSSHPEAQAIPGWARQMVIFVLEDMGELQSAKILLGGLLESGQITDPHEQRFLSQRLAELEQRATASGADD